MRTPARKPTEILLVEDNPGDIRLMQEAFKEGGFTSKLNITRNGEQAMAFLRQEGSYVKSARPALILLDLNLPRKDGREVLAEIKKEKHLRSIPVLVLSTSTNAEDIRRGLRPERELLHPKTWRPGNARRPGKVDRRVLAGQGAASELKTPAPLRSRFSK